MSNEKEINLKALIVKLREWIKYLLSKWVIIVIVGVLCGIIGIVYVWLSKPTYEGNLTFVLSSDAQMGNLASLAGQFGLNIGGGSDDAFKGDNILQLFKSRKIVTRALFTKLPGSSQLLINLIIDTSGLADGWEDKDRLKNLIPFPENPDHLQPVQDSLVAEVYKFVLNNYLSIGKVDKQLSFYQVTTTSNDERISCYLTQFIVDEASKFYIETKTKAAKDNLDMLQHEADSLRYILGSAITLTAAEADRTFNLNPAYQVQRSPLQQSQAKASALGTAYGEVVRNLEIAKIALQKATPIYQIIDTPQIPLEMKKTGRLLGGIIGGFIGGLGIIIILLAKRIYRQTMQA